MKKTQARPMNTVGDAAGLRLRTFAIILAAVFMLVAVVSHTSTAVYANGNNGESATIVLTVGSTTLVIDGVAQESDVAPFIADNRTMVPLRVISEALGAGVDWDGATQIATITQSYPEPSSFNLTIGSALPNNMGTPMLYGGRTFVPLRYAAERLGVDVDWSAEMQTIVMTNGNGNNTANTAFVIANIVTEDEARAFEREVFDLFNATRNDTGIIDRRTGNPITISQPVEWWDLLADAARWRSQTIEFYDGFNFGGCPQSLTFRVADYPTPAQIVSRVHEMLTPLLADYDATFTESMGVGYDAERGYITIAVRLHLGEYCGYVGEFITQARNMTSTAAQFVDGGGWLSSGRTFEYISRYVQARWEDDACTTAAPGCCPCACAGDDDCPACCGDCCGECTAREAPNVFQLERFPAWENHGDCGYGVCVFNDSNPVWARPGDQIEFRHTNDKAGWWDISSDRSWGMTQDVEVYYAGTTPPVWVPNWDWIYWSSCAWWGGSWQCSIPCTTINGGFHCMYDFGHWTEPEEVWRTRDVYAPRLLPENVTDYLYYARDREGKCVITNHDENREYLANFLLPFRRDPNGVIYVSCQRNNPQGFSGVNDGHRFLLWSPDGGTASDGGHGVTGRLYPQRTAPPNPLTPVMSGGSVDSNLVTSAPDVGTTWRQQMTAETTWACQTAYNLHRPQFCRPYPRSYGHDSRCPSCAYRFQDSL